MIENYRFRTCSELHAGYHYPVVETVRLKKGGQWAYTALENEILFCHYGWLNLSSGHSIDTGKLIILPPGSAFSARAGTDVYLILMRVSKDCRIGTEAVLVPKPVYFQPIIIPESIRLLFTLIADEHAEGLLTPSFMKNKVGELFMLLKAYYPRETLIRVFSPFF